MATRCINQAAAAAVGQSFLDWFTDLAIMYSTNHGRKSLQKNTEAPSLYHGQSPAVWHRRRTGTGWG
jgi:hypothetical protein